MDRRLSLSENEVTGGAILLFEIGGDAENVLLEEFGFEKLLEEVESMILYLQSMAGIQCLVVLCSESQEDTSFGAERSS